tara:strand:+ start:5437 stop:6138 length:702 start_codon:yes stop_codon:yes gene_type:complete
MQSNLDHKVFLFISQNVFIITVVDLKNEIIYSKELKIDYERKEIDYNFLNNFLKENIFKIEKKLNNFIKSIYLIIEYDNIYSVNFSIKNKMDNIFLSTNVVNNLLLEAKSCCKQTLKNVNILHMKIDRFFIDNEYLEALPDKKKCENFSIDLSFVCMPDHVLKNIKKILGEYRISVEKTFSYTYLNSFLNLESKNIYEIAQKVMNGLNENEVFLTNKSSKNAGFFEKFFDFFK